MADGQSKQTMARAVLWKERARKRARLSCKALFSQARPRNDLPRIMRIRGVHLPYGNRPNAVGVLINLIRKKERTMLKYLIKTEIDGTEIRLIQSQYGFAVLYGMERKSFVASDRKLAFKAYKECVNHALECAGVSV